jgi:hypothetical protein
MERKATPRKERRREGRTVIMTTVYKYDVQNKVRGQLALHACVHVRAWVGVICVFVSIFLHQKRSSVSEGEEKVGVFVVACANHTQSREQQKQKQIYFAYTWEPAKENERKVATQQLRGNKKTYISGSHDV